MDMKPNRDILVVNLNYENIMKTAIINFPFVLVSLCWYMIGSPSLAIFHENLDMSFKFGLCFQKGAQSWPKLYLVKRGTLGIQYLIHIEKNCFSYFLSMKCSNRGLE